MPFKIGHSRRGCAGSEKQRKWLAGSASFFTLGSDAKTRPASSGLTNHRIGSGDSGKEQRRPGWRLIRVTTPFPATRRAGFTLIEIIVVIVIMSLLAGLVLVRHPGRSAGLETEVTVRALSNALRLARSRAIAQDREVAVVTAANGFVVDGGPPWLLPSGQTLSASQVIFVPDGGSSGATILLLAGQRRIAVDVNWLTGRVRARELNAQ